MLYRCSSLCPLGGGPPDGWPPGDKLVLIAMYVCFNVLYFTSALEPRLCVCRGIPGRQGVLSWSRGGENGSVVDYGGQERGSKCDIHRSPSHMGQNLPRYLMMKLGLAAHFRISSSPSSALLIGTTLGSVPFLEWRSASASDPGLTPRTWWPDPGFRVGSWPIHRAAGPSDCQMPIGGVNYTLATLIIAGARCPP